MVKKLKFIEHAPEPELLRLDLGTGKGASRPEGFIGVDINDWEGVEVVMDLRKRWPWKNESVDQVNANYLVHYFTPSERVHFANELYRVLKPGGTATIYVPHWAASRAYGDTGVQFPPVSEMWFMMLSKGWREAQNSVDVSGYTCDFAHTLGYGLHPVIVSRNQEYQQHAVTFWKEAAQDIICTLTK
jgi:SAM-dependent methyltransferase